MYIHTGEDPEYLEGGGTLKVTKPAAYNHATIEVLMNIVAAGTLLIERPSVLSASVTPLHGRYIAHTTHVAIAECACVG